MGREEDLGIERNGRRQNKRERKAVVLENVCSDSTKDRFDEGNRSKLLDWKTAKGFSVPDGSRVADQIRCYKWNWCPTGLNTLTGA